jgi:heme/copper-type cytochrome/quinol oxidase subunit 2
MVHRGFTTVAIATCVLSGAVMACPLCRSDTGEAVRAAIVDEHLPISIVATVAPFALVLAIVALVHFAGSRNRR